MNNNFETAEKIFSQLDTVLRTVRDPYLDARCAGFASVSAVTAYELEIKDIFIEFSIKKHKVFGHFAFEHFEKINGRIRCDNLKGDYLKKYGDLYLNRFKKALGNKTDLIMRQKRMDITSAYENVLTWRNEFVHEGRTPTNATYAEVKESYRYGKMVLGCLNTAMK